jgi:hypothetical protein
LLSSQRTNITGINIFQIFYIYAGMGFLTMGITNMKSELAYQVRKLKFFQVCELENFFKKTNNFGVYALLLALQPKGLSLGCYTSKSKYGTFFGEKILKKVFFSKLEKF